MLFSLRLIGTTLALATLMGASSSMAADVTVVSGFYERSSPKFEGKNTGSTSKVSLGGRYTDDLTSESAWIGGAEIALRSYSGSGGIPTPDNSVSMTITGGARYYFKPFAEAIVPYVSGTATIINSKSSDWVPEGYNQTTTSGLYYGGNAGIRSGLGGSFFVELEIPLFQSPLFSVTELERVRKGVDGTITTKEESTDTALYVSSVAPITKVQLGLGMKL
jgi:hypothetical protein